MRPPLRAKTVSQGFPEASAQMSVAIPARRTANSGAPHSLRCGEHCRGPQPTGAWDEARSWFRKVGMGCLQMGQVFYQGGRVGRRGEAGKSGGDRARDEKGLTFGALPESVGFHAEGGAETFFIV